MPQRCMKEDECAAVSVQPGFLDDFKPFPQTQNSGGSKTGCKLAAKQELVQIIMPFLAQEEMVLL